MASRHREDPAVETRADSRLLHGHLWSQERNAGGGGLPNQGAVETRRVNHCTVR